MDVDEAGNSATSFVLDDNFVDAVVFGREWGGHDEALRGAAPDHPVLGVAGLVNRRRVLEPRDLSEILAKDFRRYRSGFLAFAEMLLRVDAQWFC